METDPRMSFHHPLQNIPPLREAFTPVESFQFELSIPALFERVAEKLPHKIAIRSLTTTFTFQELNAKTNQLARIIFDAIGSGGFVPILMAEPAKAIVAIMAALKSGNGFAPLQSDFPVGRLEFMIAAANGQVLIAETATYALAEKLASPGLVLINFDEVKPTLPTDNPGFPVTLDSPMSLYFTSGSTGAPKKVVHHQNSRVVGILNGINSFYSASDDRWILLQSTSFAASNRSIFSSLLAGASVHPFQVQKNGFQALSDWIRSEKISVFRATTTLFRYFLEQLPPEQVFPDIRLVTLGGETVLRHDFELFKKHFPAQDARLIVGLGSTEAGRIAEFWLDAHTDFPGNVVPVGYPMPGVKLFLRDEHNQDVPAGGTGEIVIHTKMAANESAATHPDPANPGYFYARTGDLGRYLPDGRLLHVGRKDQMVKVRGYRVDVNEVEGALMQLPAVKTAAVVVQQLASGENQLAGCLVIDGMLQTSREPIRNQLAAMLPDYMIPAQIILLDELPLTPSGKINRRALAERIKQPVQQATTAQPPTDDIEQKVAGIWEEVFGKAPIGITERFLYLGGHSLLAAKIIARVQNEFSIELSIDLLLQKETIADMANLIRAAMLKQISDEELDAILADIEAGE